MPDAYRLIGWAWIAVLVIWMATSITAKRTVRRQAIASRALQLCLGLIGGLLIWGGQPSGVLRTHLLPRSPVTADLGLAITLAGLAIALWARAMLGRNWSATVTVKHNHELIQSGPYSAVRHPIYSGLLLALLGTAIARGELGAFLGVAVIALTFHRKSRIEESFMLEQFGPEYAEYKLQVRSLIPFVW